MSILVLNVDSHVYRLSAIKKAAYRFSDRCTIQINATHADGIRVQLEFGNLNLDVDVKRIEQEFWKEALDQELREQIAAETEAVRNLILAQAFSQLPLLDSNGELAEFRDDPMGILKLPNSQA